MRRIDSLEFSWLRAYYKIRPFGDETGLLAEICALISNAAGAKHKDGRPICGDDFLPDERPEREIEHEFQDTDETIANIKMALAPFRK